MKKLLLIVLLIVGCEDAYTEIEEVLGNCVLKERDCISSSNSCQRFKCYGKIYTKQECMDKSEEGYDQDQYFINKTCSEFCDDNNFIVGGLTSYCNEY